MITRNYVLIPNDTGQLMLHIVSMLVLVNYRTAAADITSISDTRIEQNSLHGERGIKIIPFIFRSVKILLE